MRSTHTRGTGCHLTANVITASRILLAAALIFLPVRTPLFWACYLLGGASDVLDGYVARKQKTESRGGAILDTAADFVFLTVCLWRFLPYLALPLWLWVWIAAIAVLKLVNLTLGFAVQKRLLCLHSPMNRVAGVLLFVLPVTAFFSVLPYGVGAACAVATYAAIEECVLICKKG